MWKTMEIEGNNTINHVGRKERNQHTRKKMEGNVQPDRDKRSTKEMQRKKTIRRKEEVLLG